MTEVSATRLYLGNLPRTATKADVEAHFATHDGSDFMGERLTVQFARGNRPREPGLGGHERAPPRPRRTPHRMQISGLPPDTSWQDLKDFARQSSLDVVYSETPRDSSGRGFVEFESAVDLRTAVEKLDGREFKGSRVQCIEDVRIRPDLLDIGTGQLTWWTQTQPDFPPPRGRSRSPIGFGGRRGYMGPPMDDRRGPPPRGYSPRRDIPYGYRDRSPRRDYYDDRARGYRSPPRRPMDDYPPPPPPRGRYDDPYHRDYPPPPDAYGNGRPYDRPPRDFGPPRDPGYPPRDGYPPREYERGGRYW
ncbi:RNA recognition motif [Geosmithia morbida]|uniref:RNA recognition motif n=1 Tax=Geosmithia morbida TaxID=1094350 RepID=A0A9P4YTA6_9HYPO|nr:RNA recognition motif [Geosmithia morbida]KAF4122142.1 RNA recognition motif [Geosmithia morbida]